MPDDGRRTIAVLAGLVAILAILVIVLAIAVLSGDDDAHAVGDPLDAEPGVREVAYPPN